MIGTNPAESLPRVKEIQGYCYVVRIIERHCQGDLDMISREIDLPDSIRPNLSGSGSDCA